MLETLGTPEPKDVCGLMRNAADLSKEDFDILMDAVANPNWSPERLATKLRTLGFPVAKETIRKHRQGECLCARKS